MFHTSEFAVFEHVVSQWSLLQNIIKKIMDTLILSIIFLIIIMHTVRGDGTDTSAKKASLLWACLHLSVLWAIRLSYSPESSSQCGPFYDVWYRKRKIMVLETSVYVFLNFLPLGAIIVTPVGKFSNREQVCIVWPPIRHSDDFSNIKLNVFKHNLILYIYIYLDNPKKKRCLGLK